MDKKLLMKNSDLTKFDTEETTYGCRYSNPDICVNNGIIDVCAFCNKDHICKRPPKSWKKTFTELTNKKLKEKKVKI